MRHRLRLAAWLWLFFPALAFAHTSVGGTGSGADDPNSDCLRGEALPVLLTDAGAGDAGDAGRSDAGRTDAGGGVVVLGALRCVEHATMFGCACTVGAPAPNQAAGTGLLATVALLITAGRRPRSHRQRRSGR